MGRACCVFTCNSGIKVPSHKFPKDPKRCAMWINNLNLEHLKNYTSDSLQKFKVCYKHFRETDYSCSPHHRFLKDSAIPFIEDINTDAVVNNLQQQTRRLNLTKERNIEQAQITTDLQEQLVQHEIYNEQQGKLQNLQEIQKMEEPSILQQTSQKHVNEGDKETMIQERVKILEEEVDFLIRIPKIKRPCLEKITRKNKFTPITRKLYERIIKLRQNNRHLQCLLKQSKQENITRKNRKLLSLKRNKR